MVHSQNETLYSNENELAIMIHTHMAKSYKHNVEQKK